MPADHPSGPGSSQLAVCLLPRSYTLAAPPASATSSNKVDSCSLAAP